MTAPDLPDPSFITILLTLTVPSPAFSDFTWTEQTGAGSRNWCVIASSSGGTKLCPVIFSGYLWTGKSPTLVDPISFTAKGSASKVTLAWKKARHTATVQNKRVVLESLVLLCS